MFSKFEVYYRVTYPERTLSYINIEPFVYVGKNISGSDEEDTWYFEFLKSFIEADGFNNENYEDRYFSCLTEKDKSDMLNTDELYKTLKDVDKRRTLTLQRLINNNEKINMKWNHSTSAPEEE